MTHLTGEITYKGCTIHFTIQSIETQFSAFARILCSRSSYLIPGEVIIDYPRDTAEEAQEAILSIAKAWVDNKM